MLCVRVVALFCLMSDECDVCVPFACFVCLLCVRFFVCASCVALLGDCSCLNMCLICGIAFAI